MPITVKMSQTSVKKTNGKYHRKCTIGIPKVFSDKYPDGQLFEVHQIGGKLTYLPVAISEGQGESECASACTQTK
jgi:hypothetical protein